VAFYITYKKCGNFDLMMTDSSQNTQSLEKEDNFILHIKSVVNLTWWWLILVKTRNHQKKKTIIAHDEKCTEGVVSDGIWI
jgi:hypothetical protein